MKTFTCVLLVLLFLFSLSTGLDGDGFVTLEIWRNPESRESLFIDSLRRDTLRSHSIASKILFSSKGLHKVTQDLAEYAPAPASAASKKFSVPLMSSVSVGTAAYMVEIGVGTPPQKSYLVVDTGSDITWLQCQPCKNCYQQEGPIFKPSASSSYKNVPCDSPLCEKLNSNYCLFRQCMYRIMYADQSASIGHFATDTLTMDGKALQNIAIGCGQDNQGTFTGVDGLCGLSKGSLSLASQVGLSFSYCLPKLEGKNVSALSFGGTMPRKAMITPLLDNNLGMYFVNLTGISVGGSPLRIPANAFSPRLDGTGGVLMDSGTTITRLYTPVYKALRHRFRSLFGVKGVFSRDMFDTCYNLKDLDKVKVPGVMLEFQGGVKMELPSDGVLVNFDKGIYCLAFTAQDNFFNIIGNVQQQTFGFFFDNAKKELGITPKQCS